MRSVFSILAVLLFAFVFARLALDFRELESLRALARDYVVLGPRDLGVPNIITAILISYRGFDTLGEVAVLFMVAASVGLLLKADASGAPAHRPSVRQSSEIVRTGTEVLLPLIFIFGAYVIVNGHLSAGGGFQGGAIVASGVMLMLLARPGTNLNTKLLGIVESLAGVAFVTLGLIGLILAGGFLDPRFLPAGKFGAFISGGAIPLISALLGIKVGAELSVILDRFRG